MKSHLNLKQRERVVDGRCPKCGSRPSRAIMRCRRCDIDLTQIKGRLENGCFSEWLEFSFEQTTIVALANRDLALSDAMRGLPRPISRDRMFDYLGDDAQRLLGEHAKNKGLGNLLGLLMRDNVRPSDDRRLREYLLEEGAWLAAQEFLNSKSS